MDIGTLINRCIKIFYIARKPSTEEYWDVAKITSIGMVGIGVVGLIISFIMNFNLG